MIITPARKRGLTFVLVTVPAIFCCIFVLIAKFVLFPRVLAELFRLRQNSDGSLPLTTKLWANYPADVLYKFYMWNITNADEVMYDGAIPRLQEHGPYVYIGHERKENLTWSDDGMEVSYRNLRYWHFSPALSCKDCLDSDPYIVPNVAYAGAAHIFAHNVNPMTAIVLDLTTLITGSGPFQKATAGQVLFHSFNDPFVALMNSNITKRSINMLGGTLFGAKIPEKPEHAGLLPFYNHTHEPEYVVQTGKRNMDDVAKIIAYGGERSTDWPIGDDLQHCNNEGALNKQFLKPEDTIRMFISYVGRSFELELHSTSYYDSVPVNFYRINREEYDTNSEKNIRIRYENEEGIDYFPTWPACRSFNRSFNPNSTQCGDIDCTKGRNLCNQCCNGSHYNGTVFTPPGFYHMRVFPGRRDKLPVPVFVSPPHMLWAPEEVSSIYVGNQPDEERHRPIDWRINPTIGNLVHANARVQFNIPIWNGPLTQSSSLPNAMAPIIWLHLEVQMHEDVMRLIKLGGLYLPLFFDLGIYALLLISIISLSVIALDWITRVCDKDNEEKPATRIRIRRRVAPVQTEIRVEAEVHLV